LPRSGQRVFLENTEIVTEAYIHLSDTASSIENLSIILTLICNMSGERNFTETFKSDDNGFPMPESLCARLIELKNCSDIQKLVIDFSQLEIRYLHYASYYNTRKRTLTLLASEMQSLGELFVCCTRRSEEEKCAIKQAARQQRRHFKFKYFEPGSEHT
jgi:hypothetical protein